MHIKNLKQYLSLVLALVMVLSLLPVSAKASEKLGQETEPILESTSAAEQSTVPETEPTEPATTATPEENPLLAEFQIRADKILNDYLGTKELTAEEIETAVAEMDWDTYQSARWEISLLDDDAWNALENGSLTEKQLGNFRDTNLALCTFANALEEKNERENHVNFYGSSTVQSVISVNDTNGSHSNSKDPLTITVTGDMLASKSTKVTVTNNSTTNQKLSFNYEFSGGSSWKYNDASTTVSTGSVPALMPGESVTFTTTASSWWGTAKITLKDFLLVTVSNSSQVTVYYDSGTVKVDGNSIENGETTEVNTSGETIEATATNFVGWIDMADNRILSSSANFTLKPSGNMSVKAIHGPTARFTVGEYLYETLDEAITAATNGTTKIIVLANSGTLPASTSSDGVYTIPSGVTLLIPFDSAYTLYTTTPGHETSYTKPSAYRTLSMETGTHITVDGALSVSSKILAGSGGGATGGSPIGKCGWINMDSGSSITVGMSGSLYVYGYITGSGTVLAKGNGTAGAKVYECFQLGEYRGGSQSSSMKNKVFAVAQYYIQNIEVPITLEAGATEKCWSKVNVTILGAQGSAVDFIGTSGAMFCLTSGSVTKRYDGTTDRLIIELNGTVDISSVVIQVSSRTIDSSNFVLSLTNNITIYIRDGSSVTATQDIALMPGTEVYIDKGGTFTASSGCNVYVYDADQWEKFVYGELNLSNETDYTFLPIIYAPGQKYSRTNADLKDALLVVNGTLDASKGHLYTTYGPMRSAADDSILGLETSAGGANICSTKNGTVILGSNADGITYRYKQVPDTYYKVPVESAQLKNTDGSYTDTSGGAAKYFYAHGLWHKTDTAPEMVNGVCTLCAEAQIGSTYYWTLAEAVNAASEGGTVQLLKDVEAAVAVSKPLIIERNAHAATVTPASGLFLCTSDAAYAVTKGFTLRYAECSYEAEVVLRMKLYIPDEYLDENYTIRLTKDGRWGNVETSYTMAQLKEDGADENGLYWVMAGVASGEMTRDVTIDIQDGSGNPMTIYQPSGAEVGPSFAYTVKQYVNAVQASNTHSSAQKAAAKALAVYGGYAQQYFNVSTNKLAYEGLELPNLEEVTADVVGHSVTFEGTEAGITVKSIEPFLDSATYLRLKFLITDGSDISNFTFTMNDANGDSKTLKAFYEEESKRYCVDIPDIHAAYLDHAYTVTVTNNTTGNTHTVNASVLSWVNLAIGKSSDTAQVNMAKALYLYNQAANTLFNK